MSARPAAAAPPTDPPRSLSLTARLATALALLLVVGAAIVAVLAFAYGRSAAQRTYDRLLIGAARQIADATTLGDGRVMVNLPVSAFELLALAPEDRVVYAVFAPDGEIVTGYPLPRPASGADTFYSADITGEPARFEFPVCYLGVETWELRVVAVGDGTVELVTHVDDHAGYQHDDITLCSQLDTARIEAALEDCEAGASCDPCMMYESNAFGLDCQELPWVICTLP